jgi:hypothetical protein
MRPSREDLATIAYLFSCIGDNIQLHAKVHLMIQVACPLASYAVRIVNMISYKVKEHFLKLWLRIYNLRKVC